MRRLSRPTSRSSAVCCGHRQHHPRQGQGWRAGRRPLARRPGPQPRMRIIPRGAGRHGADRTDRGAGHRGAQRRYSRTRVHEVQERCMPSDSLCEPWCTSSAARPPERGTDGAYVRPCPGPYACPGRELSPPLARERVPRTQPSRAACVIPGPRRRCCPGGRGGRRDLGTPRGRPPTPGPPAEYRRTGPPGA